MATVFHINKGVSRSIEFKGLKAQYIWYFVGGVLLLLVLFAVMYMAGFNSFICVGLTLGLGTLMTLRLYAMSNKYGEHGLMKKIAGGRVPKVVKNCSRLVFTGLAGKQEK